MIGAMIEDNGRPTTSLDPMDLIDRALTELGRAYTKHGRGQWGRHEFYAIFLEEVDELWGVIKTDGPTDALLEELAQIIAMCLRYAETGNRYGETL